MARYTISHPELPQELNGKTLVRTLGGRCAARNLAAAHVAAILRHRGIRPHAEADDVYGAITVTKMER
ncbi:hypothetical protein [Mycolicibacterium sp.]|uniref:hypothetical protein n=1 Tax=Mycolicibacterium sp. TaxID=2320850 RepID=UPI00355D7CFE